MNPIRDNEWQNDEELQSSIKHYVMENMKRSEVIDFLNRDCPEYAWSLPTLDRRMRYFDIKYINYETTVDEVVAASNTRNDGPGQLLGSRGGTHDIFGRGCATIKSQYRPFLEFLTKKLDPFRNFCA